MNSAAAAAAAAAKGVELDDDVDGAAIVCRRLPAEMSCRDTASAKNGARRRDVGLRQSPFVQSFRRCASEIGSVFFFFLVKNTNDSLRH